MKHRLCETWKEKARRNLCIAFSALIKFGIYGLLLFWFSLGEIVAATSVNQTADIVYSARYYKRGTQPSHYKIWLTDTGGLRHVQVTSGNSEDHSPIWMEDRKNILFVRETGKTRSLCTVNEQGGPVTELARLPPGYLFIESVSPNRRMLVYLVHDASSKLILFDIAARQERCLGLGSQTAWSLDSRHLYVTRWEDSESSAHILDVVSSERVPLKGDIRSAAFLDNETLAAELFAKQGQSARLAVFHIDGTRQHEVPLSFTWKDDLSPFADNMFAIPGDTNNIYYGRHAGNSTAGPAQEFYLMNLKGGVPIVVATGRDLVWAPDHRSFITGDGRSLDRLDRKRNVWVSPLLVVSLPNGEVLPIVRGLVSVGGFDWRRTL
jgi:hypothetical protein